jgi:baseplate J-like protein
VSEAPVVDARDEEQVQNSLIERASGYTPEFRPTVASVAAALTRSYARYRALLNAGVNQMPAKYQAAMLTMFGLHLLPARGARVPLVFTMSPESATDVTLAAGSQVAATPLARLPSLEAGTPAPPAPEPPLFATERTVTLTPGRLACVYSLDPGSDLYSEHTGRLTAGFETFSEMTLTPHELYLGHDTLFALGGNDISLIVSFLLDSAARTPVQLQWEYFSASDWVPLPYVLEEDTTGGLTTSGQVALRRVCGPNAKKTTVHGVESFWIRARVATPFPAGLAGRSLRVNDIRVRVKFSKDGLLPEAAFADATSVDTSKTFYPFGERPGKTATFYLASKEVFARQGAKTRIIFVLLQAGSGSTPAPVIAWEYLNADGWHELPVDRSYIFDSTSAPGIVSFNCPSDWDETEVNGTRNHWLRATITSGDFGHRATFTAGAFSPETFTPPIVSTVTLAFDYLTEPEPLDRCISYNDFRFEDVTEDALWPDRRFQPFTAVADTMPAIHFGFDRKLPSGLVSLYFQAPVTGASSRTASPYRWEYRAADGWRDLPVLDETGGFQRSGTIQFVAGADAAAADGLNGVLFRIRARLRNGEKIMPALVSGVWLNAVWAVHQRTVEQELLGRSTGRSHQAWQFSKTPVLEGEIVEVEEWTGRGETWRFALAGVAASALRFDRDPVTGDVVTVWVRWNARPHLHNAGPDDRVYTVERATGQLALGPRALAAGQRIVATYKTGGGRVGNLLPGAVKALRLVQPMITAAINPVAAAGGADSEPLPRALARGPQLLRHRNRAMSVQDVEWVALESSPQVARARCLPLAGPDGVARRGWFKVVVVPHSNDARPAPGEELAQEVLEFLASHTAGVVRIQVKGPRYLAVAVRAIIVADSAGDSALVEARVRAQLAGFLHPLTGNGGAGWEFGEAVPISRIAAVIESTDGVAFATGMALTADGVLCGAYAQPDADALASEGAHELTMRLGKP